MSIARHLSISLSILLPISLIYPVSSKAQKIIPPNYNFSLDSLKVFYPNRPLRGIIRRHGKGEVIKQEGDIRLMRFSVKHMRYNFHVMVQVKNNKVIDFFASLPSYFLHDVFHQSLINRFGKQTRYFHQENSAVYLWKNKRGMDFIYRATCTITCFPIFLAGRSSKKNPSSSFIEQITLPSP
ncbi:MAG: hypothetical protein OXB84_02320 [Halobacteriovoraceae bacterium]|nr:hypothetical protein [Halobacteriovoraceae bacterium]